MLVSGVWQLFDMFDMLKVFFFTACGGASLVMVCVVALWNYDPTFTTEILPTGSTIGTVEYGGLWSNFEGRPGGTGKITPGPKEGAEPSEDSVGSVIVTPHPKALGHEKGEGPGEKGAEPDTVRSGGNVVESQSKASDSRTKLPEPQNVVEGHVREGTKAGVGEGAINQNAVLSTGRNYSIVNLKDIPSHLKGYLNYDVWHWIVGYLVDDLRIYREFPLYPDKRDKIAKLVTSFDERDPNDVRGRYGHKIYGYLITTQPGTYRFKVNLTQMTAAASVELWVSTDSDPHDMSKILNLSYDIKGRSKQPVNKSAESNKVELGSGAYYFEFLQKAFDGKVVSTVKWQTPDSSEYVDITNSNLAMAFAVDGSSDKDPDSSFLRDKSLPSNTLQTHHPISPVTDDIRPVTDLDVLPTCEYTSLYARVHKVSQYTGYTQVFGSKVYPQDETIFLNGDIAGKGTPVIAELTKNQLVSLYTEAAKANEKIKEVVGLHYLEETPNKNNGSRFLLEMDVKLKESPEEVVRTSEYVYLEEGSTNLCHTSNFQWTKNAEVYFVVSVKNLGLWVKHLIYNMEDIYRVTKDEHFSLVIVDYRSEDMDIAVEAKKSSFKRIHVINKQGSFSRSGGLQAGVDFVKNANSIVMTIDMHLTFPIGTVEYVRKHTVQHKMAYTPVFFRLNAGYTEINFNGVWEMLTYGLFALYKSDWTKFGGFNTHKFTTKWGGEDWDILDRALAVGFEAFRIRPAGLVHYHHTRKGMWGNSEVKTTQKFTLHSSE